MRRDKANPYDMVAITSEWSEEGKELFEVNKVGGFRVRVGSKKKPVAQQQCFRCQEFGHVQFRCTSKEVCAFCAGEHASRDCQKPRSRGLAAKCRNCGGSHPSFYKTCPMRSSQVTKKREEDRHRKVQEAVVRPGVSYSKVVSPVREEKQVDGLEGKIEEILRRLLPEIVRSLKG